MKGVLAGFVTVKNYPEAEDELTGHGISEFLVMYRYRRIGLGLWAAHSAFQSFRGRWQLKRHPYSVISVRFWDEAVGEFTGEKYTVKSLQSAAYDDATPGEVLFFCT